MMSDPPKHAADYWKSQARKFCEFCKCWIADNKPSIQFHETGKRHKENVAQKLALLTKKSVKEQKKSLKVDEEMKKMEEAAMKAYLKDIESNPDYTSQVLISKIEEKKKEVELQQKKEKDDEIVEKKEESSSSIEQSEVGTSGEEQKVWYEAQSDEGYTYYWNYLTGESIWEPPEEGYLSLAEQNSSSTNEEVKSKAGAEDVKEKVDSNAAPKADDVSKDHKKKRKKVEEVVEDPSVPQIGPSMKPDPYGGWTTVENRVEEPVDLQLPHQEYIEIKVPTLETEQPLIKFKEKTITTLGDVNSGAPSFKKRKFGAKSRGNMRQKFDDDD